ncbi:MAG: hypothetical protein AAF993_12620 [Pseudomonadota bacterium]
MTWTRRLFAVVLLVPALLFVVLGLRWLIDPAGAAPTLGLTLETGMGLSSQVADLSAFFLVAGLSILIAVTTKTRTWFYPPVMLLLIAACGRLVAWAAHGATLALAEILVELVVATLLLIGSRILPERR